MSPRNAIVNGGAAERSRVTSVTVSFDQVVSLPGNAASAFHLTRQSDGAAVALSAVVANAPGTVVTLTFVGGPIESGSLADGRYTLTVLAAQVSDTNGPLDGNADGAAGDDYVLIGDPATNKLFRLFGDADGNGTVDVNDFAAFRGSFGSPDAVFDFDSTGSVDALDFGQFRQRFGSSV